MICHVVSSYALSRCVVLFRPILFLIQRCWARGLTLPRFSVAQVLQCSVKSDEDNVYDIDCGVSGTRAVLPKSALGEDPPTLGEGCPPRYHHHQGHGERWDVAAIMVCPTRLEDMSAVGEMES